MWLEVGRTNNHPGVVASCVINLGDIGRKSILCCNFDTRKLPIYLPDFYKECLDAWSDVSTYVSYDNVVNQTIWNNKFILIENKSCYIKHVAVHGIVEIGDLISDNDRFLESKKLLPARLSPGINFTMGSVDRHIDRYVDRHVGRWSVDMSVDSRPLVGR